MKRASRVLASVGLGLTLCLYGCGGPGSKAQEEPAPEEQSAEDTEQEEDVSEEQVASQKLGSAELEVAGSAYHYELEKVAELEGTRNSISFQRKAAITFNDAGDAQVLDASGKPVADGAAIRGVEYWANGLYLFALDTDDINNTGLVSLTDGVLVPGEAAAFSYATEKPEDARFVEAVYATEETDDKDECFVYSTDKLFSISVDEGDTMYKGYAKVFDLKKGAFVDGVEITNGARRALKDLGDAFVVQESDDSYTMYNAKGKELWTSDYYVDFGTHSLCFQSDGKSRIVNTKGEVSFATDGYLNSLTSTDDLYTLQADDATYVIDSEGNVVLEGSYERVQAEYDGLFVVEADGKTEVVDGKGEVLADDIEEYTVSSLIPGILTFKNGAGKRCLLKSDGTLIEDVDGSMYDLRFYQDDKHLVLDTGAYDVTLASASSLDLGLAKGHTDASSSLNALYDLFSGEQLLDGCEVIDWAGGYIYAFKDGTWTIYQAKLVQG